MRDKIMKSMQSKRVHHVYPDDNKFVTGWYSDRCEDGDLRGTRDHYIVLRLQWDGTWVVHTGYEDSAERGYCNGEYYGESFDEAYAGFKKRAERYGFTQTYNLEQRALLK